MFDIGFPELLIVSIVALLVVGPDRLPGAIRSMSLWVGRFRRSFTNIKQEIEKEIGADEIRSQLYNESIMQDLEKTKDVFEDVKNDVNSAINSVDTSVSDLKSAATAPLKSRHENLNIKKEDLQKEDVQKDEIQNSVIQNDESKQSSV
jgi:sec-independent protein translocase protein TatB